MGRQSCLEAGQITRGWKSTAGGGGHPWAGLSGRSAFLAAHPSASCCLFEGSHRLPQEAHLPYFRGPGVGEPRQANRGQKP